MSTSPYLVVCQHKAGVVLAYTREHARVRYKTTACADCAGGNLNSTIQAYHATEEDEAFFNTQPLKEEP
ncbi:MAG: hypothetical protein OEV08_05105 [Nitrospira sp.]|nr:hypothetical protein [Nitrospira sp.]